MVLSRCEAGIAAAGLLFRSQHALQWDPANTNNSLTLPFPVLKKARYKIIGRLSRIETGGAFRLQVDDSRMTEAMNLYRPGPIPGLVEAVAAEADLDGGQPALKFASLAPDVKAKGKCLLLDKFQVSEVK
jgi:hypothetical protein